MSFFDRVMGGRRKGISPNATFRITQEGTAKLGDYGGDPKSRVLVTLETRGTSNIDEISEASGLGRGQVERLIPALVRGGYIQPVGAMSDGVGED